MLGGVGQTKDTSQNLLHLNLICLVGNRRKNIGKGAIPSLAQCVDRDMKADYERQTIALMDVLARLNAERAELANGVKNEHPALVAFTKHQNIDQLSRELLVELIDHIKVYENGNISVRFKFADEFRRIAEYIEINTTNPAVAG